MESMTKKQLIQEKINLKTKLLQDIKRAAKERENSLKQQVKMKNEKVRQLERRISIDIGNSPGREYQKGSFRLYNAMMKDARRDARATEQELKIITKENDINIKILEEEINQLRSEKIILGEKNMNNELIKLSNMANLFEESGNIKAGTIITQAMKKIAELEDDYGFIEEDTDSYYGRDNDDDDYYYEKDEDDDDNYYYNDDEDEDDDDDESDKPVIIGISRDYDYDPETEDERMFLSIDLCNCDGEPITIGGRYSYHCPVDSFDEENSGFDLAAKIQEKYFKEYGIKLPIEYVD
jgi:hypothetical protein